MKKGIADIVQRLSGWEEEPDYEFLEISDNGDNISFVVKKDNLEFGGTASEAPSNRPGV